MHGLFKLSLPIINDLIRSKAEQEVAVFRRCRADRVGAVPAGDLNGKAANSASGAVDQHALARRKPRVIEEGLPDRKRRNRDGGRLRMINCRWLRRQIGGVDRNILRGGAISAERGQRIDLVADRHIADAVRHALDDAGNLVSRYRGQALRPVAIPVRFRPGQLRRRNACGENSDERVSCAQLRLGRILVHKLLRAALSMESNGFHLGSFTDSTERSLLQTRHTTQDWRGGDITTLRARARLTQRGDQGPISRRLTTAERMAIHANRMPPNYVRRGTPAPSSRRRMTPNHSGSAASPVCPRPDRRGLSDRSTLARLTNDHKAAPVTTQTR